MTQLEDFRILDELANATNDISKGELVQLNAINNLQLDLKAVSYTHLTLPTTPYV